MKRVFSSFNKILTCFAYSKHEKSNDLPTDPNVALAFDRSSLQIAELHHGGSRIVVEQSPVLETPLRPENEREWSALPPQQENNERDWSALPPQPENERDWPALPPQPENNKRDWSVLPPQSENNKRDWSALPPKPENKRDWSVLPPQLENNKRDWSALPPQPEIKRDWWMLPPQLENNKRDWSALPLEMLHLISKKLPGIDDLIRFRVVCQRWRSASSVSDPPPQLPWFIRAPSEYFKNSDPQKKYLHFYSMSFRKKQISKIKVPQSHDKELMGSAHRYLFAYVPNAFYVCPSLLNPLTGREIFLPYIALSGCQLICIRSDPSGSGIFVAIYGTKMRSGQNILASCLVGANNCKWVTVEQSNSKTCCRTYYKGMFYVHDQNTRITEVIDASTGGIMHLILPQEYIEAKPEDTKWCFDFFVESGGDLLGISHVYGKGLLENQNPMKCHFEIHRLDEGNRNPQWVSVNSIGDQFLFLRDWSSTGVSYKASDFPRFKGNTIYFLGYQVSSSFDYAFSYLVNFDIESGKAIRLRCPTNVDTWFLPGLH